MSFFTTPAQYAAIQADDLVIYRSGGGFYGTREVRKVVRVTKAQIIVQFVEEVRFNRRTGSRVGAGAYSASSIEPATPALIAEVRAENEKRRFVIKLGGMSRSDWEKLPIETLRVIVAALEPKPALAVACRDTNHVPRSLGGDGGPDAVCTCAP